MKLYQAQVQLTFISETVEASKPYRVSVSVPTFFVLAQDSEHAKGSAKALVLALHRIASTDRVLTSGTVVVAKFNAVGTGKIHGYIDIDGEEYLAWTDREEQRLGCPYCNSHREPQMDLYDGQDWPRCPDCYGC
jgi:hypothetical protein